MPIAAGATMSAHGQCPTTREIVSDPAMMLQTGDFFKVAIIPCIALTIYALFAWKLIPKHAIDSSNVKEVKMTEAIPKKDEICIIVVFVGVMIAFFFGTKLGNLMNLAPAIGVLILIYTGSLTAKEANHNMTGDMVWMIARRAGGVRCHGKFRSGRADRKRNLKDSGRFPQRSGGNGWYLRWWPS